MIINEIVAIAKEIGVDTVPTIDQSVEICRNLRITYGQLHSIWKEHDLYSMVYSSKRAAKRKRSNKKKCLDCEQIIEPPYISSRTYCNDCLTERKNKFRQKRNKIRNIHKTINDPIGIA